MVGLQLSKLSSMRYLACFLFMFLSGCNSPTFDLSFRNNSSKAIKDIRFVFSDQVVTFGAMDIGIGAGLLDISPKIPKKVEIIFSDSNNVEWSASIDGDFFFSRKKAGYSFVLQTGGKTIVASKYSNNSRKDRVILYVARLLYIE